MLQRRSDAPAWAYTCGSGNGPLFSQSARVVSEAVEMSFETQARVDLRQRSGAHLTYNSPASTARFKRGANGDSVVTPEQHATRPRRRSPREVLPPGRPADRVLDARIPYSSENPATCRNCRGEKPCIKVAEQDRLARPGSDRPCGRSIVSRAGVKTFANHKESPAQSSCWLNRAARLAAGERKPGRRNINAPTVGKSTTAYPGWAGVPKTVNEAGGDQRTSSASSGSGCANSIRPAFFGPKRSKTQTAV